MRITSVLFAILAALLPAAAQTDRTASPMTERQLLNTLDAIGTGDPLTKAPLSINAISQTHTSAVSDKKDNESEKKAKGQGNGVTEITAKEASFDQKSHQAVFGGDVLVKNPEFDITCAKLTAFLRNDNAKDAQAKPADAGTAKTVAAPPTATPPEKKKDGSGGLEKAIAEGSVVITQVKVDADGNISRSVGRAKRAVYDAGTGDVTLTGRPEVQQGINTCVALDESTVIILNREGRMKVTGPHKTVIKDAPENPTSNAR